MNTTRIAHVAQKRPPVSQFSLTALLEFVTWCAMMSALSAVVGVPASVFLMLMALAIAMRHGFLALAMFIASSSAADWPHDPRSGFLLVTRQIIVGMVALSLCFWCSLRRDFLRHRVKRALP